ncbi:MAG: aminotransferase class IV [Deltaproteobacteria bacterium]|jgi:4-amino-4-deoxychorismate lyase|nr:aminotransferase class IV [Deltaproteobacteria bacterium]
MSPKHNIPTDVKFLETIKYSNGQYFNVPLHEERISRTFLKYFGRDTSFALPEILPRDLGPALIRVRLVYSFETWQITAVPYTFPLINNLKLVASDLYYGEKFLDRSVLKELKVHSLADDILIVQKGEITDTSIANVVFRDREGRLFTPRNCLLAGVKRSHYLKSGRIEPRAIKPGDLTNFDKLYYINAMIDLKDNISVLINNIIL